MDAITYNAIQEEVVDAPFSGSLFVSGQPGSGKTTAAAARLRRMIEQGIPAESILILAPQRTLAAPYYREISRAAFPAGGLPTIVTLGGLAQRTLQVFWPAVAASAGFARPNLPPTFLTLETAQYYMAKVVQPLLARGYFEQLVIDRNRLYSQLLDNLNKAAVVGFSHQDIASRLKAAWVGKPDQLVHYDQAQECIDLFRAYCLENNLLDYSLQFEVFTHHLWQSHLIRQYLFNQHRHLIYENIEEDVPAAHDILREWLPSFESALLIFDENAGYRAFLGADPESASSLRDDCSRKVSFTETFVSQPVLKDFGSILTDSIISRSRESAPVDTQTAFTFIGKRFYPEMIDAVSEEIARLVHEEYAAPNEIAVVSPFLSDSLRHALMHRLQGYGIPGHSYRPSHSFRDEPTVRCLLTLARMAHSRWNLPVTQADVREMLLQTIAGIDLVRADLMAGMLFNRNNKNDPLNSFDPIKAEMQERISFSIGERFMRLRAWLKAYIDGEPVELDFFLARLFGEILSQPGFGFHEDFEASGATSRLIESIQKFRRVAEPALTPAGITVGQEYLQMVSDGVIAAQYLRPKAQEEENAVFIAPAYSFLMNNQAVKYQFWLDVGSLGWWERLYQPLTHPHVLSRRWQLNKVWTDADDYAANQDVLQRLVNGLIARCGDHIYLCAARVNERGSEERGPLLQAVQSLLRRARRWEGSHV